MCCCGHAFSVCKAAQFKRFLFKVGQFKRFLFKVGQFKRLLFKVGQFKRLLFEVRWNGSIVQVVFSYGAPAVLHIPGSKTPKMGVRMHNALYSLV